MPYSAFSDLGIGYDDDGSVVVQGPVAGPASSYPSAGVLTSWQGDSDASSQGYLSGSSQGYTWIFFPEKRIIDYGFITARQDTGTAQQILSIEGSNDTTNGLDGTWETATWSSGLPSYVASDSWRAAIKPISFSGSKKVVRIKVDTNKTISTLNLYGHKDTGETPDDITFTDVSGTAFTIPDDFGDRPLGTTVVHQFKVKNLSSSKTAQTIVLTCNDTDWAISTDGVTYVTSFTIASIASGASSATLYCRNTTPAPGATLGPRKSRISASVGSWV